MSTTNTLDLNNRVTELEKAVSGGDSNQANKVDIATEFNATTAYTAGCFVYYGGKLYQFNADHAAGAWDPTDVVVANVTDQVVSNKAAIDELAESYPADNVMMPDGVTSVEDALDELTANTFGASVGLTANTPITVNSDGYVIYSCGATSGNYCYFYINNVDVGHAVSASNLTALPLSGVFVKKGMTIKFEGVNASATFYPLES